MHPTEERDDGAAAASMEMPRYVSHKKVWALEISKIEDLSDRLVIRLSFAESGYAPVEMRREDNIFSRYKPVPGDFYVQYSDGYKSFSPRKAFLEGYQREA